MPGLLSRAPIDHRLLPSAMDTQSCCSSSSSGSEHEPSSVCLAAMVDEFIEEEYHGCPPSSCHAAVHPSLRSCLDHHILISLEKLLRSRSSASETLLLDLVNEALGSAHREGPDAGARDGSIARRRVMGHVRGKGGYNAAVCKSKLPSMCGLPAGEYEYIDVIIGEGEGARRLIIDTDFRGQFEVARPSDAYKEALELVPTTFVGGPDKLKQVVDVVSEAMKQSLKAEGMPLPPWRKAAYLNAKWFSPYRRTTNHLQQVVSNTASSQQQCSLSSKPATAWELPPVGPKALPPATNGKVHTGLASMLAIHHRHHRPERLAKAA